MIDTTPGSTDDKGDYDIEMLSATDYYPFGMTMPGRNFTSSAYRYGFNGEEVDDEIKGPRNSINYKARIYDPRIGRFMSIDPLTKSFPWYSPFQFAGNKPIWASDLDGREEFIRTDYRDVNGRLYRTQIQVINSLDESSATANGIGNTQIVHNNVVVVQPNGNATATYTGTSQGASVAPGAATNVTNRAPGSNLFNLRINTSLADTRNTTLPSASGGSLILQRSVGSDGVYQSFMDSNGGRVSSDFDDITELSDHGVMTYDWGPTPAIEPVLPSGFNVTPEIGQRFVDPASPIQNISNELLNYGGSVNTINTNLAAPRSVKTTQVQPAGTVETVPSTSGTPVTITF